VISPDSIHGATPNYQFKSSRLDPVIAALLFLTFTTGLIDAVSYIGLGRVFTANMTGNVVLLGFAAAGVPGLSIARSLISLGGFVFGAVAGGRLASSKAAANRRRWVVTAILCEAGLLALAAVLAVGFDFNAGTPESRLYAIILATAIAMGLRNATVRHLGIADLTTTVLTLTLTGLAADSSFAGANNPRWPRRLLSVIAMFAGAMIGALILSRGLGLALSMATVLAMAASLLARRVSE